LLRGSPHRWTSSRHYYKLGEKRETQNSEMCLACGRQLRLFTKEKDTKGIFED
jgi:hypothetical protein